MPSDKSDVTTKYTHYFNYNAPSTGMQVLLLLAVGAITGLASSLMIHGINTTRFMASSAIAGVFIVSMPSILTAITIKAIKHKMKMKHPMFAALTVSAIYAFLIVFVSAIYAVFHRYVLASLLLILANAGIYGYWFIVDKVAIGQKKSAVLMAAVQPVLNILFYIPLGSYLFTPDVPINALLLKLYAGMAVFLAIGYLIVYLLDRPTKKALDISGIAVFAAMVQQWLVDINITSDIVGVRGNERDIGVDVVVLQGKRHKTVFVKPEIHFGPFANTGGSIATEYLGKMIAGKHNATPFILHGAVNACDNPVSTSEVRLIGSYLDSYLGSIDKCLFRKASGGISVGSSGVCRAINVSLGDLSLIFLSKAPLVTEDIERSVGLGFEAIAEADGRRALIVDAHNSRFESAPPSELEGIGKSSKYIKMYTEAIKESLADSKSELRFGSAFSLMKERMPGKKDLGFGYTSVGIFEFGKKRFGIVYFDANNMLPGFRKEIIANARDKFGIDVEVCTTDTHAVNSIALSASNALGRETKAKEIMPELDALFETAIRMLEPVKVAHGAFTVKKLRVWGAGADEMLRKAGKEAIYIFKHVVPILAVCGFVIAAWVIYIV
ncbi:MAG: DUF2070 family protein [Candidatus Micrarchaeaceae archaeon]